MYIFTKPWFIIASINMNFFYCQGITSMQCCMWFEVLTLIYLQQTNNLLGCSVVYNWFTLNPNSYDLPPYLRILSLSKTLSMKNFRWLMNISVALMRFLVSMERRWESSCLSWIVTDVRALASHIHSHVVNSLLTAPASVQDRLTLANVSPKYMYF